MSTPVDSRIDIIAELSTSSISGPNQEEDKTEESYKPTWLDAEANERFVGYVEIPECM
jgi:hypothetical protein